MPAVLLITLLLLFLTACLATKSCTEDSECSVNNQTFLGVCNEAGQCECNRSLPEACRYINGSGLCILRPCYVYERGGELCQQGIYSRTTALLLSIFLINFGAANFYIKFYALAIPQIILGLLLLVFQFGSCGAACARKKTTSKLCIFCCASNSAVSLAVFIWWLIDLILFATNNRTDGDGCPLVT